MQKWKNGQLILLILFCIFMFAVWMAPVFLAGFPYYLTPDISLAHEFTLTEAINSSISPLFILLIKGLLNFVSWQNVVFWSVASAATMALAVIPLWFSIKKVFSVRIAWAAIIIFCLTPVYWQSAIYTDYYPLAFLCLFTGFAFFVHLTPKHKFLAVALLSLFYGLSLATSHAFITFLPWFVFLYFWTHRPNVKKMIFGLTLSAVFAYTGFVLPVLPVTLQPDLSAGQRLNVLIPIEKNLMPGAELYGDEYAYLFLKEDFDKQMIKRAAKMSFLERSYSEHYRMNYGVGSFNLIQELLNGSWLFIINLAALFMQEVMGGIFLWLFIAPGCIYLFKNYRKTFLGLLGLWVTAEIILRFGFHYGRIHFMDTGWIMAIAGGAGVIFISDNLRTSRWLKPDFIVSLALVIISLQMLQANRMLLAKEYERSSTPHSMAVARVLENTPPEAVVAQARNYNLPAFTDRKVVILKNSTIDMLTEKDQLSDPFKHYQITHIYGYDQAHAELITQAVSGIEIIPQPQKPTVEITPFKKFLLNLIR